MRTINWIASGLFLFRSLKVEEGGGGGVLLEGGRAYPKPVYHQGKADSKDENNNNNDRTGVGLL